VGGLVSNGVQYLIVLVTPFTLFYLLSPQPSIPTLYHHPRNNPLQKRPLGRSYTSKVRLGARTEKSFPFNVEVRLAGRRAAEPISSFQLSRSNDTLEANFPAGSHSESSPRTICYAVNEFTCNSGCQTSTSLNSFARCHSCLATCPKFAPATPFETLLLHLPREEHNPSNTWPSAPFDHSLIDHSLREIAATGISTSAGQRNPSSDWLYEIQEEAQLSAFLRSAPSSHIVATSILDYPLTFPEPKIVSTSQNAVASSSFSFPPANIHSGNQFHETHNDDLADIESVPQALQGGFNAAETNTGRNALASNDAYPTSRTAELSSSTEGISWSSLRQVSGSGDHSIDESTSTTQSSPDPSSTTSLTAIQCTWAACGKSFLTRSEYK
jgi:hypothetical protein